jgi:hypothetical protein
MSLPPVPRGASIGFGDVWFERSDSYLGVGVRRLGTFITTSAIEPKSIIKFMKLSSADSRVPLWLKLAFTAFLLVMVPVYWFNYGPTNFLYFCDISLFLVCIGIWTERSLPISMAAVGILIPQAIWCADFLTELLGGHLVSMTGYMFDPVNSLFLRSLSFFHGW